MNRTVVLRAQKVRRYIIEHPGCTLSEIYAAHPGENLGGAFEVIQRHRLARYEGGGKKGKARWFATEAMKSDREFSESSATSPTWECTYCGESNGRHARKCSKCCTPNPEEKQ